MSDFQCMLVYRAVSLAVGTRGCMQTENPFIETVEQTCPIIPTPKSGCPQIQLQKSNSLTVEESFT